MLGAEERKSDKYGCAPRRANLPDEFRANISVRDGIKTPESRGIIENNLRDKGPVQSSVGRKYGITERVAQGLPSRFAGLNYLMRDFIRIDDGEAELRQPIRRCRLPSADTASDSDSFHGPTVAMACDIQVAERDGRTRGGHALAIVERSL